MTGWLETEPGTVLPEVLRRYMTGLAQHDVELVATTLADEVAFISQARSLKKPEFLDFLRALYSAFPDWHYAHHPIRAADDDALVVRWRQVGRHTGDLALPGFDPVQPTGREVTIPEQDFTYRVRDGLIVEIRPELVPGGMPRGLFEQIGVTPPL